MRIESGDGELYVRLSGAKVARTECLDDSILVDLAADGTVVGVEFIGVSEEIVPYVSFELRETLDALTLDELCARGLSPGELAYCVYRLAKASGGDEYARLATVSGVLFTTLGEYLRRVVAPYEDRKRSENGDVQ